MHMNTLTVIRTDSSLVLAMKSSGPAENEATFRTVKVTTPPNGHPDLFVLCLLCLQQIPSARQLSAGMTLCRNRPILRHLSSVLSALWSTRWQLVRLGIALVFTYLNIPQKVLVAACPNYALPPCVECILQITLPLP